MTLFMRNLLTLKIGIPWESPPHLHEDLPERKPPFRAYRKAVEFRQGPASEPDSDSTAKAQSDRDPWLAVVPSRAIIIATLVDWPIIAAVSR